MTIWPLYIINSGKSDTHGNTQTDESMFIGRRYPGLRHINGDFALSNQSPQMGDGNGINPLEIQTESDNQPPEHKLILRGLTRADYPHIQQIMVRLDGRTGRAWEEFHQKSSGKWKRIDAAVLFVEQACRNYKKLTCWTDSVFMIRSLIRSCMAGSAMGWMLETGRPSASVLICH
jgi:hypothetical protein